MKFNTNNVSLRISAGFASQFPRDPMPQIALSGRSNVGKSSLINTLLGRNSLARVSGTPGKTITVNFYDIDKKLFLVDLPGYGFAKRSAESQKQWSTLTDAFFTSNANRELLKLVVQLIDVRIGPTEDDMMMLSYLKSEGIPYVVVATKSDKLSATAQKQAAEKWRSKIGENVPFLLFSSTSRMGKDELWGAISQAIN